MESVITVIMIKIVQNGKMIEVIAIVITQIRDVIIEMTKEKETIRIMIGMKELVEMIGVINVEMIKITAMKIIETIVEISVEMIKMNAANIVKEIIVIMIEIEIVKKEKMKEIAGIVIVTGIAIVIEMKEIVAMIGMKEAAKEEMDVATIIMTA